MSKKTTQPSGRANATPPKTSTQAAGLNRRAVLAAGIAAGGLLASDAASAQPAAAPNPPAPTAGGAARAAAAEAATAAAPDDPTITVNDPGSDIILDVIKTLDIDYCAVNPGGSIRGLHESIIHYGGNKKPELISVMHEEIGVALAHGYARAAGKPMSALIYAILGLQHASMAVYNAWADRVPIVMFAGNVGNQSNRFGPPNWYHSAVDLAPLLTGALKWSDQPNSMDYMPDAIQKAYRIATTAPMGPVLVTLDDSLQEKSYSAIRPNLKIPPYRPDTQPVADASALADAAKMLVAAHYPVIVLERAVRSQAGMDRLAELATLLGAAVINRPGWSGLANDHPMNLSGMDGVIARRGDAFLFLGCDDVWGFLNTVPDAVEKIPERLAKPDAKIIILGVDDYLGRGNLQDQQHAITGDLNIIGEPEASIPLLTDAVRREIGASNAAITQRSAAVKTDHDKLRDRFRHDALYAWDASPVSVARLTAELGGVLENERWSVVTNSGNFLGNWPTKLWTLNRWNQFMSGSGAGGLGFSVPAALGAALANKGKGILTVAFQTDGDFMFVSNSLWTAAHHKIPILVVMHNNRAYHAEHMNIQKMANQRQRMVTATDLGTTIVDPPIDYGMLARSLGVWGTGPITDPAKVRPALLEALAVVKSGAPALVDVVTQPR